MLGCSICCHESDLYDRSFSILSFSFEQGCNFAAAPDRWKVAMGLYIISFVSYGATLVFYAAAFPRLARNTAHARRLKERHDRGEIPEAVYEQEESMEKNRISNISTVSR